MNCLPTFSTRAAMRIALLCGAALFASACDRETPSGPASADASPPKSVPDESLPADQYVTQGLPSYDRPWVGQDLTVVAAKLKALAADNPQQLPRRGSDKSGAVFARLVADDNLAFFRNRSLPLSSRFPDGLAYFQSQNEILKSYAGALDRGKVSGDDVIDLLAAELSTVQAVLELVDEFMPTIPKDDGKYEVRMHGLQTMRQGLATMVSGVLTALTESQVYGVETRLRLLARCLDTFPHIIPKLTKPSQAEVKRRLAELASDPTVSGLRPQLVSLRDVVERAVREAPSDPAATPPSPGRSPG